MKRFYGIAAAMLMALLLAGCASTAPQAGGPSAAPAKEELVLTLDELKKYNGKDGMPAYVAVDGVIYDVTSVPEWKNGDHNGFEAGNDLTDAIKNVSPHGVSKLQGVPVVGKLAK